MQKIILFLVLVVFVFGMGCSGEKDTSKVPDSKESKDVMASPPEGPLNLPEGANPEAVSHNKEGIASWNKKDYKGALMHFNTASKIDGSSGEVHFNEAISYDKLNQHPTATKHFGVAQEKANGNALILESKILLAHIQ